MWKLRNYLIKKLVGRQTVVMNARLQLPDNVDAKDFYIFVRGHYKKYIVDNVDIIDGSGKSVNYDDLE